MESDPPIIIMSPHRQKGLRNCTVQAPLKLFLSLCKLAKFGLGVFSKKMQT